MDMKRQNIELHIEELVLDGFAPGDKHRIGEIVEQELTRMLADRGVPESLNRGGEIGRLDGGAFETAKGSKPEAIGAKVAKAVYGGLKR